MTNQVVFALFYAKDRLLRQYTKLYHRIRNFRYM